MTTRSVLAAAALALAITTLGSASAADVVHPYLRDQMVQAQAGQMLDAYVVLDQQMTLAELEQLTAGQSPRARRKTVANALKAHAAATQVPTRAVLDDAIAAGQAELIDVLWAGNAILFRAERSVIEAIASVPGVNRVRPIVVHDAELYQDVAPVLGPPPPAGTASASYPFFEDFETGVLGAEWTAATTGAGYVQVSSANSPSGVFHVQMASSVDGTESTASIDLSLNLIGQTDVGVRFKWKEFSDEDDVNDGVWISDNGINYFKAFNLTGGTSNYATKAFELDDAIVSLGLNYTSEFHIQFRWDDNFNIPTDGFAFDDIEIAPGVGVPPPAQPELNLVQLQAPQLWDIGVTGGGILIANIDSGADWHHPDLVNQTWSNPGEIAGNGIDDDANGKIDDIVGWDFASNNNDPTSGATHGTNTAGLMVGDGSNGFITGMAPGGRMAVCEINGEANYFQAQQYAIDIGADVVSSSHSFKWPFVPKPDYFMHYQMCMVELAAGIIHANSIGNQGSILSSYPIPWNVSAPGNCPQPWIHPQQVPVGHRSSVLGCGGLQLDDTLYTSSGQGLSAWEDITLYDPGFPHVQDPALFDYPYGGFGGSGPGLLKPDVATYTNSVLTTTNGTGYSSFGGTSAATPQLGGGMMLLRSSQPEALPRHVAAAIELTAVDLGPGGKDTRYGSGKLQVFDAARRLVVLGRASSADPAIGTTVNVDLFGEPNTTVFGFLSAAVEDNGTDWNLSGPFTLLGAWALDGSGTGGFSGNIPNNASLVGLRAHLQFGATVVDVGTWGTGPMLSVPESLTFTN